MDISKLSDADLKAVADGDFSRVSTEGLQILSGQQPPRFQHRATDSAMQGATFGFSDELGALKDAALGRGGYSANLRDRGMSRAIYERENPGSAIASELAGAGATSLIPGLGAFNATRAAATGLRLGPNAARYLGAAVGGGTAGAITGAGTAPEGERMDGAARGGVTGMVAGPVVAGGLQGIGKVGAVVRDVTSDIPAVNRVGQAIGAATGNTLDYAERAREKLLQAMQRDRVSPDQIDLSNPLGPKPETLIERSGGRSVLGLADISAKYPGAASTMARDLAEERMGGQGERLTADLSQAFRVQGDPVELSKSFSAQRAAQARPLYEQAYREGAQLNDPRLADYMTLPAFKQAYGRARRIAKYDGVNLPADPAKLTGFDLQTLDYVKRGLDDVLYSGQRQGSLGNTELNRIRESQQGFLQTLDELVPTYREARAAWAGPTAMKEALETGQKVSTMTLSEVQQAIDNMPPSQLEQFKIGALAGIRQKMSQTGDGRDLVRVVYGSPEKRDIIRALVGDDEFTKLEQQFARERSIRRTDDKIRGNSSTVERQIARDDFEADTSLVPSILNQGLIRGPVSYALRSGSGVPQATADRLGPMMFSTDPAAQQLTLQQLMALDRQLRARAAGRGTFSGTATGGGAGLLGDMGQ